MDTILAFVVFIELQYMDRFCMDMVSFLQRKRENHNPVMLGFAGMHSRIDPLYRTCPFVVKDICIFTIFFRRGDLRARIPLEKAAAMGAFGTGNCSWCDGQWR